MSVSCVADVPAAWDVERHREYDAEHGGPVFMVRRHLGGARMGGWVFVTLAVLPSGVRHYWTDNGRGLPFVVSAYLWGIVDAEEVPS